MQHQRGKGAVTPKKIFGSPTSLTKARMARASQQAEEARFLTMALLPSAYLFYVERLIADFIREVVFDDRKRNDRLYIYGSPHHIDLITMLVLYFTFLVRLHCNAFT